MNLFLDGMDLIEYRIEIKTSDKVMSRTKSDIYIITYGTKRSGEQNFIITFDKSFIQML